MGSQRRGPDSFTPRINKMAENPEIWKATPMADHFDKIQKLSEKVDGCPNFRRVPGYKVYCCDQPTVTGFEAALNKACGDIYPKDGPIVWINMRQEPVVYVNGQPICARPPNKTGEYAELGNVTSAGVLKDEEEFVKVLEGKVKNADGKLKYVDVSKKELEVEAKEIISLEAVVGQTKEKFPGLVHLRIPVCNSAAPLESDFDTLCSALSGTKITTPVIINCQVGLSRSTTGCVAACLFREFQMSASFEGLMDIVPGVDKNTLKMDRYNEDPTKDPLFRGEFEVIRELTAELGDEGVAAKRECVKIMDNIHKYFYLITFAAYIREVAVLCKDAKAETPAHQLKITKTFSQYMEEHAKLRTIVEDGKGKLQWDRPIPPKELANLEALVAEDFQKNLGKIIHDIYQSAHGLFQDLPQGDHKKRAKYRFASKILMRILPPKILSEVEAAIASKSISLDLYEILGQCTWNKGT